MKRISEKAYLTLNKTDFAQREHLIFVQLDDDYSVDNRGQIFKILNADEAFIAGEDEPNGLQYKGESVIYNYDGIFAEFAADSESAEIYHHCRHQAELLFDEAE